MNFTGLKISIIGAVRSGIGAAKLAKRIGAIPFVSDMSSFEKLEANFKLLEAESIAYEFGGHTNNVFECDLMITSPGVPSDAAILVKAKELGIKVISELEFAWLNCKGKVIGITGTNGKTTTTALCDYTINAAGIKCRRAGNIGLAFSEIVLDVQEDEYVALEISSFQLDHIDKFSPWISVILNITPDHLDRYDSSITKYTSSKMKITSNQDSGQFYISNKDDKGIPECSNEAVNKFYISLKNPVSSGGYIHNDMFVYTNNNVNEKCFNVKRLSLKGAHNRQNALTVFVVAKLIGINNNSIAEAFTTFPGVEHRLEFVRTIGGVDYINDSKATNVDSVWYALQSFDKPIYLILGGKDKGNDYTAIKDLVKDHVKKIYAIGSSKEKVEQFFKAFIEVELKETMQECVSAARQEADENSVLLLSPACASFDMFDNYEHRGKVFKEAVMGLN